MLKQISERKKNAVNIPIIAMLLANIPPIIGVLFFDWDPFAVVSLYWAETLIIGLYVILKIISAPERQIRLKHKLIGIPIFSWFIGWFMSGHGVAIIFFFLIFPNRNKSEAELAAILPEGDYFNVSWPGPFGLFELGIDAIKIMCNVIPKEVYTIPLLCLGFAHGVSFIYSYIVKRERDNIRFGKLISEPFARILTVHLSIMIGAFLLALYGSSRLFLVCLIVIKCLIEILLFLKPQKA